MNPYKTIKHLLITLLVTSFTAQADDALLKKGNTWEYDIKLTIPHGVNFKPEFAAKGEMTTKGTLYKFKEVQQSLGISRIDSIELDAARVNIFINGDHKKQQVLKNSDGALLYFGTFIIDKAEPNEKKGHLTKAPIILYTDKAKIAEKWEWKHNKIPAFRFRMISKDVKVTVKAGTFTADKIKMEQVDNKTNRVIIAKEIWYVKDTGVIKEVEKQYVPGGKAVLKTLELTKFSNQAIKK